MVLVDWILPLLIGIVSAYLLLSILYNNTNSNINQHFADLGALIQLETSKPLYYMNFVPENNNVSKNVYNSLNQSTLLQPKDLMIGTREFLQ